MRSPTPVTCTSQLAVNGEIKQTSNTEFMIMSIERQIAWASIWYRSIRATSS